MATGETHTCSKCGATFDSEGKLNDHQRQAHGQRASSRT